MDTARDVKTHELVEAEELWNMTHVDSEGYICRGCTTQVFPASYNKQRNKKRPYFSLGPVNKHKVGCDVDGAEKVVKRARKARVGTPEGFPVPFPNKLTLTDERRTVPDAAGTPPVRSSSGSSTRGGAEGAAKLHHGHTVKTIRPACRTFIDYPHDREHLPLAIPGVPGDTYARVCWYLGSKRPEPFRQPTHLYYAAIRWAAKPVVSEEQCELTLNAGEWDDEKKTYKKLIRVLVDWSSWSQARRDTLLREFETTRAEAAEQAKADSKVKGWLFFVGTHDATDPAIFHTDDHRLICSLAAKMEWPSKA